MFVCAQHHAAVGPRISPVKTIVTSRVRQYVLDDKVSHGKEIVQEIDLCSDCAGIKVSGEKVDDAARTQHLLNLAAVRLHHAQACNGSITIKHRDGTKTTEECKICRHGIELFSTLPKPVLSQVLADTVPTLKSARFSLALIAMENLIDRTNHAGQRAKHDVATSMFVLKGYEQRGGGL